MPESDSVNPQTDPPRGPEVAPNKRPPPGTAENPDEDSDPEACADPPQTTPPEQEAAPPQTPISESSRKINGVAAVLVVLGPLTIWAALSHPPIDAEFRTGRLTKGTVLELQKATVEGSLKAEIGSVGFSQIPPPGPAEAGGQGKELLIFLRVSEQSCRSLEAEIGGSCSGRPRPPLHPPERFTIRSEGGAMEALLSLTPAKIMQLGQNAEPTQPGPPREWSLRADAHRATLTLRCRSTTSLGVTLLPGQAHPHCAPDAAIYKLLITNRLPYLPILSFNRARTMVAAASAQQGTMTAEPGTLTLGGSATETPGLEPTEVALDAAGSSSVSLDLRAPDGGGNTAVVLKAREAEGATLDGQEEIPSRLDRDKTARTLAIGVLVTLFLTVVLELSVGIGRRKEAE
jgi:hypothetical protein